MSVLTLLSGQRANRKPNSAEAPTGEAASKALVGRSPHNRTDETGNGIEENHEIYELASRERSIPYSENDRQPSKQRPKLLLVTTVPQSLGFLRYQVAYLTAHGLEVEVVSSPGVILEVFGQALGVRTHPVMMVRRIDPIADVVSAIRLCAVLRSSRPTIIHASTPKGGLLGMISGKLSSSPILIYGMWGLPYTTARGIRRVLLQWTERVACWLSDEVLCLSHSLRATALGDDICRADKLNVLLDGSGFGIDVDGQFDPVQIPPLSREAKRNYLNIPNHALVIGFVGRLVRDKGLMELDEAWHHLREEFTNARLLLVGPIESKDPLPEETLGAFRADPRVIMAGEVDDVVPFLGAMDLFVLPTYREGLPISLLEASALQLPVVATQVTGCTDVVVDGVTGALVPPRDATSLAKAIRRYLMDQDLRHNHGRAGREHVRLRFRREDLAEATLNEYLRLLNERGFAIVD